MKKKKFIIGSIAAAGLAFGAFTSSCINPNGIEYFLGPRPNAQVPRDYSKARHYLAKLEELRSYHDGYVKNLIRGEVPLEVIETSKLDNYFARKTKEASDYVCSLETSDNKQKNKHIINYTIKEGLLNVAGGSSLLLSSLLGLSLFIRKK